MSSETIDLAAVRAGRPRPPKRLLLAFLGEFAFHREEGPLRTAVFIEALTQAGVGAAATRATLDRLAARGLLARHRSGREVTFELTAAIRRVLQEGRQRVDAPHPFDPQGSGWTLVSFSIPEARRTLRHRLRAILVWEGFAPIRDGLWLCPGQPDLVRALEPIGEELRSDALIVFHARDLEAFPIAPRVRSAWALDSIREAHLSFIRTWQGEYRPDGSVSAVALHTMLVADWLALLRSDPRLPREFLGDDWPSDHSLSLYRRLRPLIASDAARELPGLFDR